MATLIARGCRDCNLDIAFAEIVGPRRAGYIGTHEFHRIASLKARVYLNGDDQTGKQCYAVVVGRTGFVLRNHLIRFPNGRYGAHLCECESGLVKVELFEGHVQLIDDKKQVVAL